MPSTHESNGTITAVSALQVIKEYRDRESHKLNVILHNIPESDSTETSAHISHDTKIVAGIADKIGIGSVDASTTMRLGEKILGRSQLTFVTYNISVYSYQCQEANGSIWKFPKDLY